MTAPTHIAVPIGVWSAAVTLISKELTIEKGNDVYTALTQCRPVPEGQKLAPDAPAAPEGQKPEAPPAT
jgi:hypothetical protein